MSTQKPFPKHGYGTVVIHLIFAYSISGLDFGGNHSYTESTTKVSDPFAQMVTRLDEPQSKELVKMEAYLPEEMFL